MPTNLPSTMNRDTLITPILLPELMSLIISYLVEGFEDPFGYSRHVGPPYRHHNWHSVANYATVCSIWQAYIEYHTFSRIHLTPSRLEEFQHIVQGVRRRYVRDIHLDVVLPEYNVDTRNETAEEESQNNIVFTRTFQTFFHIMHSWTWDKVYYKGISLVVKCYSPSDYSRLTTEELMTRRDRFLQRHHYDRRFSETFLYLQLPGLEFTSGAGDETSLEPVTVITELQVDAGYGRHVWPAACSQMAARLPNLVSFRPYLWDCGDLRDGALRKLVRKEFAQSMHLWPSSIRHFELIYDSPSSTHGHYAQSNIIYGRGRGRDLFSINLHSKFQQLTSLTLSNVTLDHFTLFRSLCQTTTSPPPSWPHLSTLTMTFTIATRPGEWLLPEQLHHGKQWHSPYHYLAPEPIDTIFLAAGEAVHNMPVLKEMRLSALGSSNSRIWFKYQRKGSRKGGTALWEACPLYVPVRAVVKAWERVGVKGVEKTEVVYKEYDDSIMGLFCFEHMSL